MDDKTHKYIVDAIQDKVAAKEEREIDAMLMRSMAENNYSPWGAEDLQEARDIVKS